MVTDNWLEEEAAGWEESAKSAAERWGLTPEVLATVGDIRIPRPAKYVEASLIRALSDAL